MVSCERPRYDVRLVQLIHGDTNPEGPASSSGRCHPPSTARGRASGSRSTAAPGSRRRSAGSHLSPALTVLRLRAGDQPAGGVVQVIASQGQPFDGAGWALALSARGELQVVGADGVVARLGPMRRWQWCLVALSLQAARLAPAGTAVIRPFPARRGAGRCGAWPEPIRRWRRRWPEMRCCRRPDAPLLLAAARNAVGATVCHLDGRIDRPPAARRHGHRSATGGVGGRARRQRRAGGRRPGWSERGTSPATWPSDRARDVSGTRQARPGVQPAGAGGDRTQLRRRGDLFPAGAGAVRCDSLPSRRPGGRRLGGRLLAAHPARAAERHLCPPGCRPTTASTRITCRSWCARRGVAGAPRSRC